VLFLLYHYFAAGEMYNAIRVYIAAYVWMTGFGNFLYYYKTQDFGGVRCACAGFDGCWGIEVAFRAIISMALANLCTTTRPLRHQVCLRHLWPGTQAGVGLCEYLGFGLWAASLDVARLRNPSAPGVRGA